MYLGPERKIKRKKYRNAAAAVAVIGALVFLFLNAGIEKAHYSKDLKEQIKSAEELLRAARREKTGNGKGLYTEYALSAFERKIEEAKEAAGSGDRGYSDIKEAYEHLKKASSELKGRRNGGADVVSEGRMKKLAAENRTESFTYKYGKKGHVTFIIDGRRIREPKAVNLTASRAGPWEKETDMFFRRLGLKGGSVALHHQGSFGGVLRVKASMDAGKGDTTGYVYRFDAPSGIMAFAGEAKLDRGKGTAEFDAAEGGVYLITAKDLHSSFGRDSFTVSEAEERYGTYGEEKPAGDAMDVYVEISCAELSRNLSRLRKKELTEYIPEDGEILPKTKVTVRKGSTAFDALDRICRDRGIHLETSYTPAYRAYYVEGIGYIYEFDAGRSSGWTYRVNGRVPQVGCSSYRLKNGDSIKWEYGLGLGKNPEV